MPDSVGSSHLISVVMPAYNEGPRIFRNLLVTSEELRKFKHEIILVNDGSTDQTLSEAERASCSCEGIRIVSYDTNNGKGFAVKTGIAEARGDYVVVLDSDLEVHPSHIPRFVQVLESNLADVAVASKTESGSVFEMPPHRRVLSDVYYYIVKSFILPIGHEGGLQAFKKEVVQRIGPMLFTRRYGTEIELLLVAHKRGFRIAELPSRIKFKGEGGMGLLDFAHCGMETMLIWVRDKILGSYL